jgi:hypothetical protein
MLVHPTSTAASKGNRILHMLETPADGEEFTDVGAPGETAASSLEEDVMVPDTAMRKKIRLRGVHQLLTLPTPPINDAS